jgi:hypothetical protein
MLNRPFIRSSLQTFPSAMRGHEQRHPRTASGKSVAPLRPGSNRCFPFHLPAGSCGGGRTAVRQEVRRFKALKSELPEQLFDIGQDLHGIQNSRFGKTPDAAAGAAGRHRRNLR